MPISAPASHSVAFSGFRSGFPRLSGARPGPACDASGANVVNLSNAPGCRPDCPTAARRRSVESFDRTAEVPHPGSELGWTEMLAFGYNTPWDVLPKALLRSYRPPTVTKA